MRLLNQIDGYCIRGENGGVIRTLANSDRILASAMQIAGDIEDHEQSPWYGFSQVDPTEWSRRIAREFVDLILNPPPGTRVSGFKEIRYTPEDMSDALFTATIDFLALAFENSRILFNTRDAAEVARSGWWARNYDPAHVKEIVATCDRRFREAQSRLGPERSFLIDYSQYNRNPAGFLPLLDWLGEKVPANVLQAISSEPLTHLKGQDGARAWRLLRWIRAMRGDGPLADHDGSDQVDHRLRSA